MNSNQRCTVPTPVTPTAARPTSTPSGQDRANTALSRFSFGMSDQAATPSKPAGTAAKPVAHLLRDLLLVTFMGAAVLAPSEPQAATVAATAGASHTVAGPYNKRLGLRTLSDSELAAISGQGEAPTAARSVPVAPRLASLTHDNPASQILPGDAQSVSPQTPSALKVLQDVGKLLHPLGKILQANITLNDVVYDTADRAAIVKPDGSVTFVLPKTIGHLSVQDVRISGSTGSGFGNIDIRGIDLRGTQVSVRTY
jgi:hypothetical protein